MAERKSLSKKVRFEVFKRDSFACQYCGKSAPDVILEVDHIVPVAEGGDNDLMNLITACRDCNRGKGKRKLSDNSTIAKQKAQLDDINERREQLDMMFRWKQELQKTNDAVCERLEEYWMQLTNCSLTDHGRKELKDLTKKFTFEEIMDAMEISSGKYANGKPGSIENAFNKIGGVCYNRKNSINPNGKRTIPKAVKLDDKVAKTIAEIMDYHMCKNWSQEDFVNLVNDFLADKCNEIWEKDR